MEPTANKSRPQDIVDTTDSLEAVGACRSMKNLLFWVIFVGLLVPQLFFWLDRMNLIDKECCSSCECRPVAMVSLKSLATLTRLTAEMPTEKPAADAEPADMPNVPADEKAAVEAPADIPTVPVAPTSEAAGELTAPDVPKEPYRIPCKFAAVAVAICNFLVLIGAVLYCLSLLMCLKISLTGRLGGINHVTRAFFVSLLMVVVLIPWQKLLPGVLVGVVWTPGELLCTSAKTGAFWTALFYLRFVGLWIVGMWLLFWAQIRSAKWAQATLRRLGIVR